MAVSTNINPTEFQRHSTDTGSSEVIISQWTKAINNLTKHLQRMPKDFSARKGLSMTIARIRKALDYLKRTNFQAYSDIIQKLNIRR